VHPRDRKGIGLNQSGPAKDYLRTFDDRKDSNPNE